MSAPAIPTIASELAVRFRLLARALDRIGRLEGQRDFAGWLSQLAGERATVARLSETLVLLAMQAGTDEVGYPILCALAATESLTLAELARRTGLDRTSLYLQLGKLAHAGLVAFELDSEAVRVTPLGRAVSEWVTALIDETARRIAEWLELIGGSEP